MAIGTFSRATLLSIKQLRRFHEQGVLVPAAVDPDTGYRLYAAAQIHDAAVVSRLRDLDLPLADVATVLAARDPQTTRAVLAAHSAALQTRRAELERVIVALQDDSAPAALTPIHVADFEPGDYLEIVGTIESGGIAAFLDAAYVELEGLAADAGVAVTGPSVAQYPPLITEFEEVRALVPVEHPVTVHGRARNRRIGRMRCAVAVHHGPYQDFADTYGQLGAWVAGNAVDAQLPSFMDAQRPVFERYLVDLCSAPSPADLRTEIWWPVENRNPQEKP